ncbi:MAG TPA: hypothetical protein VFV38_25005, partial [Ktedonobacteraceae bacterium]|nr:hypothetical protein [Ktedonobacteraceae bacterium]
PWPIGRRIGGNRWRWVGGMKQGCLVCRSAREAPLASRWTRLRGRMASPNTKRQRRRGGATKEHDCVTSMTDWQRGEPGGAWNRPWYAALDAWLRSVLPARRVRPAVTFLPRHLSL